MFSVLFMYFYCEVNDYVVVSVTFPFFCFVYF